MTTTSVGSVCCVILTLVLTSDLCVSSLPLDCHYGKDMAVSPVAQLGPRPFYLVNDMKESDLKTRLTQCAQRKTSYSKSDRSVGHRGACLQFPEHSKESYEAAAVMGAGVIECDVTFTKDKELVCRHSQCDLHTTTDILLHKDLSILCSQPFVPATFDEFGHLVSGASAKCCTSDLTFEQFKSLRAKMDGSNVNATNVQDFVWGGTPVWRTNLYESNGTVMSHKESIHLFKSLGVKMTPEKKKPLVPMPFDGFSETHFAQKIIDEYLDAGVDAENVYPQSENLDDILYWLENATEFGNNALYLWSPPVPERFRDPLFWPDFPTLLAKGVRTFAPVMYALIDLNEDEELIVSDMADAVQQSGMTIKTWTLERSGSLYNGGGDYYQSVNGQNTFENITLEGIIERDGDVFVVLDFLFQNVGIESIFTDWASTVTFYTNCMMGDISEMGRKEFDWLRKIEFSD